MEHELLQPAQEATISLPNGLVLCLEKCYYVPSLTRNIISVACLYDNGFDFNFTSGVISILRNGLFYVKAISHNGIFELDLQSSCNENSVYNIDNKRSKSDLNRTYLWHCRLGHINQKRISKLHRDGLLESFDLESYDTCESCLLGKMTKSPFTGTSERASVLLAIVHTDVCGPFNTSARGGYNYFITFTDDFSRYGYVYLLRHKSEAFECFKEFQNKVENQLGMKIKAL